jgi:hypothetical protein
MATFLYLSLLFSITASTRPAPAMKPAAVRAVTACAAVSKADVEQALGRSVSDGKEQTDATESTCDYTGVYGQVTVTIQRLPARPDIAAEIDSLKRSIPGSAVRDAEGLGSRAFFLDIAGAGTQLHVIRGEKDYLLISVLGFGEAAQVSAAAERIARKALDRM